MRTAILRFLLFEILFSAYYNFAFLRFLQLFHFWRFSDFSRSCNCRICLGCQRGSLSKRKKVKKKVEKMSRRFITTFFKLAAKDNLIHEKKFLLGQETKKMVFFVMLKTGNATNCSIWQTTVMFTIKELFLYCTCVQSNLS